MTDLATLIRNHTDQLLAEVDPVTPAEATELAAGVPIGAPLALRSASRRRSLLLAAAAVVLLALVAGAAVFVFGDDPDEGGYATDGNDAPDGDASDDEAGPTEPYVPSDLDLVPRGRSVDVFDGPALRAEGVDLGAVLPRLPVGGAWQEELGVDVDAVERVLSWTEEDGDFVVAVTGGVGGAPPEGTRYQAEMVDRTLVVAGTTSTLAEVADRHRDAARPAGQRPEVAGLVSTITERGVGQWWMYVSREESDLWYSVIAVGRCSPPSCALVVARVADDVDADAARERVEGALGDVPRFGVGASTTSEVDDQLVITRLARERIDSDLGSNWSSDDEGLEHVRTQVMLHGDPRGRGSVWPWVLGGGAVVLLLAAFLGRFALWRQDENVEVIIAQSRISQTSGGGPLLP